MDKGVTCEHLNKLTEHLSKDLWSSKEVLNHPSSVVYHKEAEHAGQKWVCGACGKSFKHRQLLQRHQLVHSQARPYSCKMKTPDSTMDRWVSAASALLAFLLYYNTLDAGFVYDDSIIGGVAIGYSTPLTMLDTSSKIMKGSKGDATVLKPTCITCVPLIMDRISKGITDKVARSGEFANAFFKWAYTYKQTWMRRGYDTPILNKIMFTKVTALLGGRVRLMISGGAPLSPDTHTQVRICLCCDVVAGYGLTETTSSATVMDPHDRIWEKQKLSGGQGSKTNSGASSERSSATGR